MRFTLGAIHEVLRHRRFAATVAYMPATKSAQDSATPVSTSIYGPPGVLCVSGFTSVLTGRWHSRTYTFTMLFSA